MLTCPACRRPIESLVRGMADCALKRTLTEKAITHEGWCACTPRYVRPTPSRRVPLLPDFPRLERITVQPDLEACARMEAAYAREVAR